MNSILSRSTTRAYALLTASLIAYTFFTDSRANNALCHLNMRSDRCISQQRNHHSLLVQRREVLLKAVVARGVLQKNVHC